MTHRPDHYPSMDLRQQLLFEAQQQTDAMARVIELLEVLTSPAEVVVIEQEVVAIEVNESEDIEPEESPAIKPMPVTIPRPSLVSRLFGQRWRWNEKVALSDAPGGKRG